MSADPSFFRPTTPLRAKEAHPLNPRCPMHLRRVCGVCVHFEGGLRDAKPARCAIWDRLAMPGRRADTCRHFERKGAK